MHLSTVAPRNEADVFKTDDGGMWLRREGGLAGNRNVAGFDSRLLLARARRLTLTAPDEEAVGLHG